MREEGESKLISKVVIDYSKVAGQLGLRVELTVESAPGQLVLFDENSLQTRWKNG